MPSDGIRAVIVLITRAEAKERGIKRFFVGEPCKRGHIAERYTSDQRCSECLNAKNKAWREANLDKARARARAWCAANRDKVHARNKASYDADRDKAKTRNKAYYEANREKLSAKDKMRYAANRDENIARAKAYREANHDKVKAGKKSYVEANSDKVKTQVKVWREANPDRVKAQARAWQKANPDKAREIGATRRARKLDQLGVVSPGIRAKLRKLQKGKCANCHISLKEAGEHLDHRVPLALGGRHEDANLELLCQPCNLRKSIKDPLAFAREEGRLL